MKLSRRVFLSGLGAGIGAAKLNLTLADTAAYKGSSLEPPPVLVNVFLRGGMDGLSFMPPREGDNYTHYETLRPDLHITPDESFNVGDGFGLHPECQGLRTLWGSDNVGLVHAVGHPEGARSRSHFDSMQYIELGTPGDITTDTGWLTRHLQTAPNLPGVSVLETLVSGSTPPTSLLGRLNNVATIGSTSSFHPNSGTFEDTHLLALEQLYSGAGSLDQAVSSAVDAVQLISSLDLSNYTPGGGVEYPSGSFGDDLATVAQLIREDLGVAIATVDFGGWDDHTSLAGNFANRVRTLSDGLFAFYKDLRASGYGEKVIVVMQTEFGRRARENADNGVDHGSGAPMAIIGGARVKRARHGVFPGLSGSDLLDGQDVYPTTDYRRVLSDVVSDMLGNPNIDIVFPGFDYTPMGIFFPDQIFESGFD